MKIVSPVSLILSCALTAVSPLPAQDQTSGIRVTTTLHDDGSKTVTKVDMDNHTSEASTYDAGDKLKQKIVYALDETQQPKAGAVYAPNGKLMYRAVYTRDGSGHVQQEQDYSTDGKLLGRFIYHYGSNGRVARIDAYDAAGNLVNQNNSNARPDPKHNRKNR